MSVAIVTGAAGLVGSATVRRLAAEGLDVVGLDNDGRQEFFGAAGSTAAQRAALEAELAGYRHETVDISSWEAVAAIFARYGEAIALVVHAAAQPSHDWSLKAPLRDFAVNATGTAHVLEAVRQYCPAAVTIFVSTNKVYGDRPNHLPLAEGASRWEPGEDHPYAAAGIDESMSLDASRHSLFGASKLAADALVQEYGHSYGLYTACFRCGCITGGAHSGVPLHGFLSWLGRCAATGRRYTVIGYKGKQVRDNLHAGDLAEAFWRFFQQPQLAAVYNMGGGPDSNCSVLEAIAACERLTGQSVDFDYEPSPRGGDHIWWISDTRRFQADYPGWRVTRATEGLLAEILAAQG